MIYGTCQIFCEALFIWDTAIFGSTKSSREDRKDDAKPAKTLRSLRFIPLRTLRDIFFIRIKICGTWQIFCKPFPVSLAAILWSTIQLFINKVIRLLLAGHAISTKVKEREIRFLTSTSAHQHIVSNP
jgi:hypothetical protein